MEIGIVCAIVEFPLKPGIISLVSGEASQLQWMLVPPPAGAGATARGSGDLAESRRGPALQARTPVLRAINWRSVSLIRCFVKPTSGIKL